MLIDCDVHHPMPPKEIWLDYLAEPYRTEWAEFGGRQLKSGIRHEDGGNRWDTQAKTPQDFVENLFNVYGHRYGILTDYYGPIAGMPDPDYTNAVCRAMNDYTIDQWLPVDDRFVAGIKVPLQDPQLAVAEIERLADHPQVVAVLFFATANRIPFGQRYYWPIYEACQRHEIPIHIHPSTTAVIANHASTPAGMGSTYLETHTCLPQFYMAQMVSLVLEGVFEVYPGLKIAMVEGGFAWLPHVLWRMDKEYKALRQQAPRLKRLPSEYVKDHLRLTSQPIEEPQKQAHLLQLFEMMDAENVLMYASDYPHYDFDEPSVIPQRLDQATRQRILHDNAADFFNLPISIKAKAVV